MLMLLRDHTHSPHWAALEMVQDWTQASVKMNPCQHLLQRAGRGGISSLAEFSPLTEE